MEEIGREAGDLPRRGPAVYANEGGLDEAVAAIHKRFSHRMHDLGEFMKGLLQRFTQWCNRAHSRTGRLWEDRFKSVIVEDGVAAKTISGCIDLNPVRAAELSRAKMRRCLGRCFTDGARKMGGDAAAATGMLWSLRDLRKGI